LEQACQYLFGKILQTGTDTLLISPYLFGIFFQIGYCNLIFSLYNCGMVKKGALKVIKPRKERKSSLLKFPEVQGIVNLELKLYIAVNDSSYTKIGDITGVSKARFSEMKI